MKSEADGLLIIGYGNSLRGDDAAGPRVARELSRRGFTAIATHQLTPELAQPLSAARLAVFVDADAKLPPGEIRLSAVPESRQPLFEHHAGPGTLLRLAREVYGRAPAAWLLVIGAASYEFGGGLTDVVRGAVHKAVAAISRLGPPPSPSCGETAGTPPPLPSRA